MATKAELIFNPFAIGVFIYTFTTGNRFFRMAKILVTGAAGQLGSELRRISQQGGAEAAFLFSDIAGEGSIPLDIADRDAVAAFVARHRPDVIVNAAAYTAVDRAEDEPEPARRINADGARVLAQAALAQDIALIHVSTDYVFDGRSSRPYREDDATGPAGVYGRTKLEGESAVRGSGCKSVIIRTSWLYSSYGANFVKTMIRLGGSQDKVRVVADQTGSPTCAADLAGAIVAIIPQLESRPQYGEIYHYCNRGQVSWCEFAAQIMRLAGLECEVEPISTAEYPTKAVRPAFSVLDTAKIKAGFGLEIPDWKTSLEKCVNLITDKR